MTAKLYRPCVGITLFNPEGRVFVGERLDSPGAWQMPQGGIDEGESLEDAFFREMNEEIGTTMAEIIRIHNEPIRYDLPGDLQKTMWDGQYAGQEQTWIAARFTGHDEDINIEAHDIPEFKNWQWTPLDSIVDLIVPFKKDTYRKVISAFKDLVI